MRSRHLTWLAAGLAALLAAGCAGPETADTDDTGTARVGLITPQAFPYELTRISVDTNTGASAELTRDPGTGVFIGSLILPVGIHELSASAFVGAELVGVSSPVPAEIQAGVVTQITIQILDISGGPQPDFGPLLASLSHPTSTTAGTEAVFAASIVDPDGTVVALDWSDDCDDSTFTAPQSDVTGWSKATPGTCHVTVTGTSGALSASTSFSMVVFPAGANQGAVDIIGEFVGAPLSELQLTAPDGFCFVNQFVSDASCQVPVTSPTVVTLQAFVNDWQNGTPGSVSLFDDCGGSVGVTFRDSDFINANWLPPVQGGICRITVRAVSQEGVLSDMSMAVLVPPGTPRQPSGAPSLVVELYGPYSYCFNSSGGNEIFCGLLAYPGSFVTLNGSLSWADTLPGSVTFSDTCGGTLVGGPLDGQQGFTRQWQAPPTPVTDCTMTLTATSLEGVSRSVAFRLEVL